jgi:spore maturation protein A
MLNYVWLFLIVVGILTAVGFDLRNETANTYRNGIELETTFLPSQGPGPLHPSWDGVLEIPSSAFNSFYGIDAGGALVRQPAVVSVSDQGEGTIVLPIGEAAPGIWKEMAKYSSVHEKLSGTVRSVAWEADHRAATVRFALEPIRYTRMKAVTQAAFDYAATAVTIALGLVGIMALWLGVMKIAEEAGILRVVAKLLAPVMRRLFPDVPSDHPAVSAMIMNIAANMLGLSNAATPLGIKAMEELNKLNPKAGTATNAMVTFLAINTGGLILIPATALAVRSAAGSSNPGIIIGTSIIGALCATVAGVFASKVLERLKMFRIGKEDAK